MKQQNLNLVMLVCLLIPTAGIQAQVLEMPQTEEAMQSDTVVRTMPGRGMTMEQVEDKFGSPAEKYEPVGEPPITRWVYGGFTVYFEDNYVLHSVTHQ